MIIKQCTKLLPFDTSLYTVYAVFDGDSESLEEVNLLNDHISKEMKIYIDEKGMLYSNQEEIESFVTPMKGTSLLLCSDSMECSITILRTIRYLLAENNIEPLVIETHNNIDTSFWEAALQYNHTVSAIAYDGFGGGGIAGSIPYEALKDIVSEETYDRYVLHGCTDHHSLPGVWTPYSSIKKKRGTNQPLLLQKT